MVIPGVCTARDASAVHKHSCPCLRNPKQGDELVCVGPALITNKYLMIGFPGRLHFLWQPREPGRCSWGPVGQGEWELKQQAHQHEISSRCPSEDVDVFSLHCSVKQMKRVPARCLTLRLGLGIGTNQHGGVFWLQPWISHQCLTSSFPLTCLAFLCPFL